MAETSKRTYNVLIDYVEHKILEGDLKPGDRLPPERELTALLGISRSSVREGLRVLEHIGVVASEHGSGNYISDRFQQPMSDILSLMYWLKGKDRHDVTVFREMIEREAMKIGIRQITPLQKEELRVAMEGLMAARSEKDRIEYDRRIHSIIVHSSNNDFLLCNYEALIHMIEQTIETSRSRIISGMISNEQLDEAHQMMALGMIEQNEAKAMEGLERHFNYMYNYDLTES